MLAAQTRNYWALLLDNGISIIDDSAAFPWFCNKNVIIRG